MKKMVAMAIIVLITLCGCNNQPTAESVSQPPSSSMEQKPSLPAFPTQMTLSLATDVYTIEAGSTQEILCKGAVPVEPVFEDAAEMPYTAIVSVSKDGEVYWEDVMGALKFFTPSESGKYDYRIMVRWQEDSAEDVYTFN